MLSTHDAADAVLAHRPSWDRETVATIIGKLRHLDPSIDAVKVALLAAKDPSAKTPQAILFDRYRPAATTDTIADELNYRTQVARRHILDQARANTPTTERIAEIRAAGPIAFPGPNCWRHPRTPAIHPYDECAGCIDERHTTNQWRENTSRPIQPPMIRTPEHP